MSPTIDLDELQYEAEKLVSLLQDRHPDLMSWNDWLFRRLTKLKELIREAGV